MNNKLLIEFIKNKGLKLQFIAEQLGITTEALRSKLNEKTDFWWTEVIKLCEVLSLTDEEKEQIFFTNKDDFK